MRKASLFLLSILSFILPLAAQRLPFTHLGIEKGLSNNYVTAMAQDAKGCIWMTTESGLNQFDGYTITTYKSNNSNLKEEALNTIYYNQKENRLWIGGKFNGLYIMDCADYTIHYLPEINNKALGNIGYITSSADGGLWLAPYAGELVHYDGRKFKRIHTKNTAITAAEKRCLFDDGKGNVYIGYNHNGLDIIDLKTRTKQHFSAIQGNDSSLPGNSVYAIFRDSKNNIWLGTNLGLSLFNPVSRTFTTFRHSAGNLYSIAADHIYDIKEMTNGELWIASDIGGISILNINDLTFKKPSEIRFRNILPTNSPNGLSSGNIRSLLMDKAGNIYIGNYGSGVDFIGHEQPLFETIPYMTSGQYPKPKPVWGLCLDRQNRLWAGSEDEIIRFENNLPKERINITPALNRPYGQVFTMIDAGDGNLLLGIYDDGLLKFNMATHHISSLPLKKKNTDVITCYKDKDKSIYIGTEDGLYHYKNGQLEKSILNASIGDKSIYGIVRDRQGKLWIASYSSGITVFDKNNRLVTEVNVGKGFCSDAINHLMMDSKGRIWAATRNGIGYIPDTNHPERFFSYGYRQKLSDNFVRSIQEDADGNIWISTNNGISLWNKREQQFDNYNYRDGIPLGNFIEGSSVRATDGTLYFGSLNGICHFDPRQLLSDRPIPPVQIISCKGLNGQIDSRNDETIIPFTENGIRLPHNRNSFRISFSVPDYALSQQVEYAYRIKGLENKWTNTLGENTITFRNLPHGHYTFQVKARLKNQKWDEAHIATLHIYINPPLWWTWYAKAFYILLLLLGIAFWLHVYKRRLQLKSDLEVEKKKNENEQELNEERLRFYTNITHELRTPLTLILGPLEDLTNDQQLPAHYQPRMKVIYNSARRLLALINQLLEFRKTETQNRQLTVTKEDLGQLVTEIGLRFKELNRNQNVRFNIQVDTAGTVLYFDRDIITTILNNLLSNAVKYTPEGSISLYLHNVEGEEGTPYTEIVVSDTGYGIAREVLPHIFDRYYQVKGRHQASGTGIGLALVRSLVHLHEGLLYVDSEPGKGTTFTIRLKTDATYPKALHEEKKTVPESPEEEPYPQETADRQTIVLVIEDNDDIRDYIASSFDPSFKVLTAANGKDGWEQAERAIPDIIISDIMMPMMDGIELCRNVKEDIRTSHIPVILLTAKDSLQDKEEGYDSGADSYLTKPFSAKLLFSRVHNLLESRRKLAALISNSPAGMLYRAVGHRPAGLNKVSEEFLKKFVTIVEDNITKEELDMPFMADKMNMSHSTLYRKIKSLTGKSGNEYIRNIKLNYSIRLMQEKGLTISEAAYNSGFNDISYYRRCFKKQYGMLPSEYIKRSE